jgi:hypothetical protein
MTRPLVQSLYWNNIPALVLEKQAAVFRRLGIPLQQCNAHKVRHGVWMNECIAQAAADDTLVFCDIDAFPMNLHAYQHAVHIASLGEVFGLGQFSNHRKTSEIYAGPMFLAFSKSTWERLGCPDMRSSPEYDAGEALSLAARREGVTLRIVKPSACVIPKYALGHEGIFGIGTFYGENDFFHLFESRDPAHEQILAAVADDVAAGRALDFANYLCIAERLNQRCIATPPLSPKHWLRRIFS